MTRFFAFICFLVTWNLVTAQDLLITNARIIDGAGQTIEHGSVLIADGRIVSVTQEDIDALGAVEIDASGMTVMPGLINTHWHVLSGVSPASSDAAIDQYIEDVVVDRLESLLERGVTTIMSAGDHFPNILELRRKLADGEMRGPRLLAVGPLFTASTCTVLPSIVISYWPSPRSARSTATLGALLPLAPPTPSNSCGRRW